MILTQMSDRKVKSDKNNVYYSISIMTLVGCWRCTGTPTQTGVETVGDNKTTPLCPDSLLGKFTKASESRISDTITRQIAYGQQWRSLVEDLRVTTRHKEDGASE